MSGVPVKMDKNRAIWRDQLSDLTEALMHHLEIFVDLPHIFKRRVVVIFYAVEVALAAQERGIDVDEIYLVFKAVLEEIIHASKVVRMKKCVLHWQIGR